MKEGDGREVRRARRFRKDDGGKAKEIWVSRPLLVRSWQPGRLLHALTKAAGPLRGEHVRLPGYGSSWSEKVGKARVGGGEKTSEAGIPVTK